ncbi:MAG: hypothetical protein AAF335_00095 [Bacteroidota bacterium]
MHFSYPMRWGIKVHQGFLNRYMNLVPRFKKQLIEILKKDTNDQELLITGHSQGAAVASLFLLDALANEKFEVPMKRFKKVQFLFFALPSYVFYNKGYEFINKKLTKNNKIEAITVINYGDPVTTCFADQNIRGRIGRYFFLGDKSSECELAKHGILDYQEKICDLFVNTESSLLLCSVDSKGPSTAKTMFQVSKNLAKDLDVNEFYQQIDADTFRKLTTVPKSKKDAVGYSKLFTKSIILPQLVSCLARNVVHFFRVNYFGVNYLVQGGLNLIKDKDFVARVLENKKEAVADCLKFVTKDVVMPETISFLVECAGFNFVISYVLETGLNVAKDKIIDSLTKKSEDKKGNTTHH